MRTEKIKKEKIKKEKVKKKSQFWNVLGVLFLVCVAIGMFVVYGPYDWFREFWISSAMSTQTHEWLAEFFYDQSTIEAVLAESYVIEPEEDTDATAVIIGGNTEHTTYSSKYEEQVLKRDPGNDSYKIIPISGYVSPVHYYKGYLAVIYDPSKVKLAVTKYLGTRGEYITTLAQNSKAKIAINASGFRDPKWMGNGGEPHGIVIKDGKLIWDRSGGKIQNVTGFNKDNVLVLTKTTAAQAIKKGYRDAVCFAPFLIVNGKAAFVKGSGGWGIAPRTAIGQRKDGIVLLLVIDGRQAHSIGADLVDMTQIMQRYGAYNASNLDGGSSTALVESGTLITKPTAAGLNGMRYIPNAWVVK